MYRSPCTCPLQWGREARPLFHSLFRACQRMLHWKKRKRDSQLQHPQNRGRQHHSSRQCDKPMTWKTIIMMRILVPILSQTVGEICRREMKHEHRPGMWSLSRNLASSQRSLQLKEIRMRQRLSNFPRILRCGRNRSDSLNRWCLLKSLRLKTPLRVAILEKIMKKTIRHR